MASAPKPPTNAYRKYSLFPKTLSKCVENITRPVLKTQGLAGSRIISEWKSIVGEKLANHCLPQKLSFPTGKKTDGTLSIAVENGFAPELQHSQILILERLAVYFGYRAVARITISHTYVPENRKEITKPIKKTLSADSMALVEQVDDEELRAALTGIARTLSKS
jgi:hypothetical protein